MAAKRRVVALLRGINVGGGRRVPMADLRAALTDAGTAAVATYLQSGNVAFDTSLSADAAADLVHDTIAATSGVPDVDVVIRTAAAIDRLIREVPYPVDEPRKLHVAFLGEGSDDVSLAAVDPDRFAPDRFSVVPGHVYLWLPGGVGRSKANNDFWQRTSGVPSTMRNWATVTALADL